MVIQRKRKANETVGTNKDTQSLCDVYLDRKLYCLNPMSKGRDLKPGMVVPTYNPILEMAERRTRISLDYSPEHSTLKANLAFIKPCKETNKPTSRRRHPMKLG